MPSLEAKFLNISLYKQKYTLSCETASLHVLLKYKGINANEDNIIKYMPMHKNPKINNYWGNPYIEFVGSINGIRNKYIQTGYGVYNTVIKNVAKNFNINIEIFEGNMTSQNLKSIIDQNRPIIAWIGIDRHISNGVAKDFLQWKTKHDKIISTPLYEHTVVIYGYELGSLNVPAHFYILDVLEGIPHKIEWYKLRVMMQQMKNMIAY